MTVLEQMLAQVAVAEVNASTKCVTCIRNTNQKYCYDERIGTGQCCDLDDTDSAGCNQKENAQLFCSTDKTITTSSLYEVCPHNPDQCDTKMLKVNNTVRGKTLSEES